MTRSGLHPSLAIVLALAALGCAARPRPAAPSPPTVPGAPSAPAARTWREVTTEHFVLRTDLSELGARDLAVELERLRVLLLGALGLQEPAGAGRIEVVAFSRREDLRDFVPAPEFRGRVLGRSSTRPVIALSVEGNGALGVVLAHELAHVLSVRAIARQPRWLSEGLAAYFSSVGLEVDAEDPTARALGVVPQADFHRYLERRSFTPVRQLLEWPPDQEGQNRTTSWLLVQTLAAERRAGFADYAARLARGDPASEAWSRAFPEWSPQTRGGPELLDRLLADRARHAGEEGTALRAPSVRIRPEMRALSPAEAQGVRLLLARDWEAGRLQPELDEALRLDPDHAVALSLLARDRSTPRLELARRAVAAHPKDPDAWSLLASSLPRSSVEDRTRALRRAVELAPRRTDLRAAFARVLLLRSPAEAEREARRAVEAAPWSAFARSVHALALAGIGRCAAAQEELRLSRALPRLEFSAGYARDTGLLRRGLERSCAGAAAFRAELLVDEAAAVRLGGDHEHALELLGAALALDPGHTSAWGTRGSALLHLHRLEEAEEAYRRQLEVAPDDAHHVRHNLGVVLARQGRREEAALAYRAQLEVTPDSDEARTALADVLLKLGRPAEALEVLEDLERKAPPSPSLLVALGRARLAAGHTERGLADLEQASRTELPEVLNDAAYALAEANAALDRAEDWADQAVHARTSELRALARGAPRAREVEVTRNLVAAWDTNGWVLFRLGALDEAERWVSAAVSAGADPDAAGHLAEILLKRGELDRAKEALAAAHVLRPDRALRDQLEKLASAAELEARLDQARAELLRRRVLLSRTAPGAADADERVLLVLAPDGRVADVVPAVGRAVPGAEAFRGAPHPVRFVGPDVPRLVVPGRLRCGGGACALLLGDAPAPSGKLPAPARELR